MKSQLSLSLPALLACLSLLGATAPAATIITPTGATTTGGNLSNRPIEEAINGNGLSGGGLSGDVLSETHNVNSTNGGEYYISSAGNPSPVLTFALGSANTINAVHLWNYTRGGEVDRAIQDLTISFSSDGTNFGNAIDLDGWTQQGTNSPIPVESRSFAAQSGITHVRLSGIVNYGDPNYTGLSEIRFSAVPEPGSLLLLGAGGLLLLRRRR